MSLSSDQPLSLIDAALAYAARGWPVFPCSSQTKAPLVGNDIDPATGKKIPRTGGAKKATTDPAHIRTWWLKWPRALIGVATGFQRLFVVDFDPRVDEATGEVWTLERLKAELEAQMGCAVPPSLTSVTQSGGVHIWLEWPDDGGPAITNRGNLPLHVDVRGEGGYVIAPPSVMASGRDYHWLRRDGERHDPLRTPIAQAPAALVAILRERGPGKGKRQLDGAAETEAPPPRRPMRPPSDDPQEAAQRKWALAALDREIASLSRARQGERGAELNRIGFTLGQLVGAEVLSEAMAIAGLIEASTANGLTGTDGLDQVRSNAERAVRDGRGHPRDMSDVGTLAGQTRRDEGRWADSGRGEPTYGRGGELRARVAPVVVTPSTLPDGSPPFDALGRRERVQLRRMADAWLDRELARIDWRDEKAAGRLAWHFAQRVAAGLIDPEADLADPARRSRTMALGLMIAAHAGMAKSWRAGLETPLDIAPMRLMLRCARFPLTDFGIAERFNARFGQDYRYTTAKGWLAWDGMRWAVLDQDEKSPPAEVIDAIWRTIRAIQDEAAAIRATGEGSDGLDYAYFRGKVLCWHSGDVAQFGRQSETTGKPEGVQKLARRWLTVPIERFDCDPLAVNVQNGTLRFSRERDEDGRWRAVMVLDAHRREDLNTKICPAIYDATAVCPIYDGFLAWAQPDAAMRRYLRQVMGYTLTGLTGEQKTWFHYGRGANGKSTAFDIWAHVAGDYAGTIGIESFLDQGIKKRGDAASPDLARLGGVRFLRTSEPARGARLDEALIKALTGGEPVAVRALHRGFFDLRPAFKPHIAGNYRPEIPGTDEGIWRRVRLVPWAQHRAEGERDEALPEKLKGEAEGVLRWMVDGLMDWLENGLVEPDAVTAATAQYRDDSDPLARFLRLCVEISPDDRDKVQSSRLYEVFLAWCKAADEKEWTQKGFSKAMLDKGFRKKASDGMQWLGMKLLREAADFVDEHGHVRPLGEDGSQLWERGPPVDESDLDEWETPPF